MGIIESKVNKYPLRITHPTFIVMEKQKDYQYLRWLQTAHLFLLLEAADGRRQK